LTRASFGELFSEWSEIKWCREEIVIFEAHLRGAELPEGGPAEERRAWKREDEEK